MQLPQLEFSRAEHGAWEQERAVMYTQLQGSAEQASLLEGLRQQHSELKHKAIVLAGAGVQTVPVNETQNLILCHTSPSSTDGVGVLLACQTTHTLSEGNTDTQTHTLAVFGEKIGLQADVDSAGRNGFGVWAGKGSFFGVGAVRRSPSRHLVHWSPGRSLMYVPYADELHQIEDLLGEFQR